MQPAPRTSPDRFQAFGLTSLALLAFAANSLLCRMALGAQTIDAKSFTVIRLASGAVVLCVILQSRGRPNGIGWDWKAAFMLAAYAVSFSFAYITLAAGTGALILFGAVQLTMFVSGLRGGEHFSGPSWLGLLLALGGLIYLVSPGVAAPAPGGAALMTLAGVAWGIYSLRGRGAGNPLAVSARNFLIALPLALVASLLFPGPWHAEASGVLLAIASGAVASGLGYVIWYAALRHHSATSAATVQLSVPLIAAVGGVLLLSEPITPRLLAAGIAILGGIALVLSQRKRG